MRVTSALVLSLLLLAACARTGDPISMTSRETPDAAVTGTPTEGAAPNDASTPGTPGLAVGDAAPAPVRDIRTATFALG